MDMLNEDLAAIHAFSSTLLWTKLGGVGHILVGILVALAAIIRVLSPVPHRVSYKMERTQGWTGSRPLVDSSGIAGHLFPRGRSSVCASKAGSPSRVAASASRSSRRRPATSGTSTT
jgi:hypothetical protein